jgi:hypothetical protein
VPGDEALNQLEDTVERLHAVEQQFPELQAEIDIIKSDLKRLRI